MERAVLAFNRSTQLPLKWMHSGSGFGPGFEPSRAAFACELRRCSNKELSGQLSCCAAVSVRIHLWSWLLLEHGRWSERAAAKVTGLAQPGRLCSPRGEPKSAERHAQQLGRSARTKRGRRNGWVRRARAPGHRGTGGTISESHWRACRRVSAVHRAPAAEHN